MALIGGRDAGQPREHLGQTPATGRVPERQPPETAPVRVALPGGFGECRRECDLRARAESLLRGPVGLADPALEFDETVASTWTSRSGAGTSFPRCSSGHRLGVVRHPHHQFGFRPGAIGEQFATALLAKASEGVTVEAVVDGQGSRAGRVRCRESTGGCWTAAWTSASWRATRPWARSEPAAAGGRRTWDLGRLGHFDHGKFVVVDGRTGWVGGAGVEDHFHDGRFHDLFVRVTGPSSPSCSWSSSPASGGWTARSRSTSSTCSSRARGGGRPSRRRCC